MLHLRRGSPSSFSASKNTLQRQKTMLIFHDTPDFTKGYQNPEQDSLLRHEQHVGNKNYESYEWLNIQVQIPKRGL